MPIYDEKGLRTALENLNAPPSHPARPPFPARWRRAGLAFSILTVSTGVFFHVVSFLVDLEHVSGMILGLALASIGSFGAMLAASRVGEETRRLARRGEGFGKVMASGIAENIGALKRVPPVAIAGAFVAGLYFGINFLMLFGSMAEGSPVDQNGELLLMNHGTMVRPLERAEFRHLQTLEFRGMSGHFIMFSGIAALGFAFVVGEREQAAS